MKEWIDSASYEELLSKWKKADIGDPYTQGEVGEYFEQALILRKAEESTVSQRNAHNIKLLSK